MTPQGYMTLSEMDVFDPVGLLPMNLQLLKNRFWGHMTPQGHMTSEM